MRTLFLGLQGRAWPISEHGRREDDANVAHWLMLRPLIDLDTKVSYWIVAILHNGLVFGKPQNVPQHGKHSHRLMIIRLKEEFAPYTPNSLMHRMNTSGRECMVLPPTMIMHLGPVNDAQAIHVGESLVDDLLVGRIHPAPHGMIGEEQAWRDSLRRIVEDARMQGLGG